MKNILTVVGARPQFVKAAVVSRVFSQNSSGSNIREIFVHTGQHYDNLLSDVFFKQMHIPKPDYNLGIGGGGHGQMTGQMLQSLESILKEEKPDIVLVYGDTNSTLAGALAAAKLHIPVAHVESGLRSFNMRMPEEINRIITDQVSNWLFCPTKTAVQNLKKEGFDYKENAVIHQVGDVMYDAILFYRNSVKPSIEIDDWIKKHRARGFYLCTLHRAENTDDSKRLDGIMSALREIALKVPVIMPMHPRTRNMLTGKYPEIHIVEPVGYFDMIALLTECDAVFTDSGGLQKEAYFCGKPCVTMREETEWIELVEARFNILAGADPQKIVEAEKKLHFMQDIEDRCLYGKGDAGEKIVRILSESLD